MSDTSINIPNKAMFRPDEVADLMSVKTRTVAKWRQEGKIEGKMLSPRCVRYTRVAIIKFLNSRGCFDE